MASPSTPAATSTFRRYPETCIHRLIPSGSNSTAREIPEPLGPNAAWSPSTPTPATSTPRPEEGSYSSPPHAPKRPAPPETFGEPDLDRPPGSRRRRPSGTVYVADPGHRRVAIFTPVPYLPTAIPTTAHAETPTEELLRGQFEPPKAGRSPIVASKSPPPNEALRHHPIRRHRGHLHPP